MNIIFTHQLQKLDNYKNYLTIGPLDNAPEDIAVNNYDGIAETKAGKWIKKVSHYIKITVAEGVIQETPGDHGRNLFYFPGQFNLDNDAISYDVCEFHGDELISDEVAQNMNDFLSLFEIDPFS